MAVYCYILMGLLEDRARNVKDAEFIKKKEAISKKAKKVRKKIDKKTKEVSYTINGKVKKEKMSNGMKVLLGFVCMIIVFFSIIWTSSVFTGNNSNDNNLVKEPDITSIKAYQTYLKDHPEEDFDGDGLDNSTEEKYNTNVWKSDSDNDGLSDYAEVYITETSPIKANDDIAKIAEEKDSYKGNKLSTPYKIDDVVMWPDTYLAKAKGGVVKTLNGYRFYSYQGWAQFPTGTNAYKYVNGIHSELSYNEDAKAFYINDAAEIRVYDKPLDFEYLIHLPFVGDKYFSQNIAGEVLSHIFPKDSGLIYCHKQAVIDKEEKQNTEIDITGIDNLTITDERFSKNDTSLAALDWVYKMIQAGKCVSTSLYSDDYGELLVIIYGYTDTGDFLVADEDLNKIGSIKVYNISFGELGKNNDISYISRYEWKGLGFSSLNNDRISFLEYETKTENDENEIDQFLDKNDSNTGKEQTKGTAIGDASDNSVGNDNTVQTDEHLASKSVIEQSVTDNQQNEESTVQSNMSESILSEPQEPSNVEENTEQSQTDESSDQVITF